jgi:hypothetical protein
MAEPEVLEGPDWGDEAWQEDRLVFTREERTREKDGSRVVLKELVVGKRARDGWNKKNPKLFNPDTALRIIQYIGSGAFQELAAVAAGVCKATYYNWLKAGRDPNHPRSTDELRAWVQAMDEAAARAEARAVQGILQAGTQSWQAYAWYLERKYPERWRQRNSIIPEKPDGTEYTGGAIRPKSSEELIREVASMQAALKATETGKDASGTPDAA